jgi:hypothetical protein
MVNGGDRVPIITAVEPLSIGNGHTIRGLGLDMVSLAILKPL